MKFFRKEARRLLAAGADPRRAGQAAAAFFGLPRAISAREVLVVGAALGAAVTIALALLGYLLLLDGNVRVAILVRSAVPDIDRLSRVELTARLAATPGRTDPEASGSRPDVVTAVSEHLRADLAALPEAERGAAVDDLVRLRPLLHDEVARRLARTLFAVPRAVRVALAQDDELGPLLVWVAPLSANEKRALTTVDLKPVVGDPERRALLQALPTLDPIAAGILARWKGPDPVQRRTLAAVLSILAVEDASGDGFARLVAAYQAAAPSLAELLRTRLAACSFANRRACR